MPENVKLNLYDVKKCGYYEDRADNSLFCNLNEMLDDLRNWIADQELQQTKTYEEDHYSNRLSTYCVDLIKDDNTGDFLLTTWNQTPADQGNYASINLRSSVGQYDLDVQAIPDNHVPGYPTYFWFLANRNKFCTVRFNNPLNGHPNLKLYLKNYLRYFSSWVIDDGGQENREILGYGESIEDYEPDLNPIFNSRPSVKTGNRAYLVNKANRIRKVMRKDRLEYINENNPGLINDMFNRIGVNNDQIPEVDFHDIRFEIDKAFTQDEVGNVFDYWVQNLQENDNQVEDIGFKFRGNTEDYWLSRIIQKKEFEIDVLRRQEEVADADSLLTALIRTARDDMVAMI